MDEPGGGGGLAVGLGGGRGKVGLACRAGRGEQGVNSGYRERGGGGLGKVG